jgi:indolepyruvate ferredoxin oxidoreductase beta subunit
MNAMTPIRDGDETEAGVAEPITVAVLAMGGQGGSVLVDWIVALAESQGFVAQSTSVPGVAQRTGATIYYVEMIKERPDGRDPVLALMATPGKVDIVIGAELMEAGRAMLLGLVSPDRTTLIASSHRSYAVAEKIAPGDGIADDNKVYTAAQVAAKRFVAFDMEALAERTGSAISAVMFGALAGADALPFPRESYEAAIRKVGVGVKASLRAFAAGVDGVANPAEPPPKPNMGEASPKLEPIGDAQVDALIMRARSEFPAEAHAMLAAGLSRVIDFQDVDYGREYLDMVATFLPFQRGDDVILIRAAAKYIAGAMAYDDVIRVADLKTRASRFKRVRAEVIAAPDQLVAVTEFMHPRIEEVIGTLPTRLGLWLETRPRLLRALDRVVNRGRRVRTTTVHWFLPLYLLAGLRRFRRGTLRHRHEVAHREAWLEAARTAAVSDPALATAIIELRRLVKGYSDTHARGLSKFDKALAAAMRLRTRHDAADWVRRLRDAALADEDGKTLDGAIATVATL